MGRFHCNYWDIRTTYLGRGRYVVAGCAGAVTYRCIHGAKGGALLAKGFGSSCLPEVKDGVPKAATSPSSRSWPDDDLADLIAPESGWPAWAETGLEIAPRAEPHELSGEQIFALVSASVHRMDVRRATGIAQGSAVAVSSHALLTNCHGLAGAQRISIRSGDMDHPAVLAKADPASDRCVLEVPDLELKPVLGLRSFADLKIGEVAYSVGTAQGLEQTFGAGIVSGLRQIDEQPFIQTSAPISSGSSGGGLFDARGNLIGITTFVRLANKGVAQALNFAIPADRFLKP